MPLPVEIEAKFELASEAELARLRDALGGPETRLRQTNRFFDGTRGELAAARIALRLRREERGEPAVESCTLVTIKTGGGFEGGIHRRFELEAVTTLSVEEGELDPSRLLDQPLPPIAELRRRIPALQGLVCLGGFVNDRLLVPAPVDLPSGGQVELRWELDRTIYGPDLTIYEVEIELGGEQIPAGVDPAVLLAAIRARLEREGIACRPQPLSKFARFRAYASSRGL